MANNRVLHFEIPANEPKALVKFYSDLFGWKFQKAELPGPEYWLCDTGSDGPGINGAVMQRQDPRQPWMNYVDVASIDAAIETATKLGATVALPKTRCRVSARLPRSWTRKGTFAGCGNRRTGRSRGSPYE